MKLSPLLGWTRRGHHHQFVTPQCKTDYRLHSFLPQPIEPGTGRITGFCPFYFIHELVVCENLLFWICEAKDTLIDRTIDRLWSINNR